MAKKPKVSGADRAYAGEIRAYLVQQKIDLKQGEALIKGHHKEIEFHRAHIKLLKSQLQHQRQRARCVKRDHDKWRKEVGLPRLTGKEQKRN